MSNTLEDLIKRYTEAQTTWRANDAVDDRPGSHPDEWRAYMDMGIQIIEHRCSSLGEASLKAKAIASDDNLFDIVQNGCDGEALRSLLMSMVIEPGQIPPVTMRYDEELALLDEIKAAKDRLAAIITRIEGKKQ